MAYTPNGTALQTLGRRLAWFTSNKLLRIDIEKDSTPVSIADVDPAKLVAGASVKSVFGKDGAGPVAYTAQADNSRGTVTANADGSWTFVASDAARHTAATTGLAGLLAPKTETITVTATSREQLDELYRTLSTHPMVKVVL